jgi:hypothetical protein
MRSDGEAPPPLAADQEGLSLLARLRLARPAMDRLAVALIAAAVLADGAMWLYLRLRMHSLPDVLPIHYSSSGQVDRIGVREQLYVLPIIGLAALVLNGLLALAINERERNLSYVLLSVAVAVQLLAAGAAIQLVH